MQEHAEGPRSTPLRMCEHCGATAAPGDDVCRNCGADLPEPSLPPAESERS